MAEKLILNHERIDDIPLLIGLMLRLRFPEVLDRWLGYHGNHQGLTVGWLATVWLAYILSTGDHRKSSVEEWVCQHQHMVEGLIEQPVRRVDFTDDRLGSVLWRFSNPGAWVGIETELWHSTLAVYEVEVASVRLDSTTTYGYHTVSEDGIMQYGHSKDHRPDLPQLKLMAAAAEPSGHLMACDVHPGQAADDPLYQPLLARVRRMMGRSGLLYVGDSKMAAWATRVDIVAHKDFYLVPLPMTGETAMEFDHWVDAIVAGDQMAELVWDGERLLGGGYEFAREQSAEMDGEKATWTERVQVVRSLALAQQQTARLEQRLEQAEAALWALTPLPGRGRRQYRDEAALHQAVAQVLEQHRVLGLLRVGWEREDQAITRYVGPGRPGPNRRTRTEHRVRYVISHVQRDHAAMAQQKARLGWRIQATNLPTAAMSLAQCVVHYRGGWCLERDFHLIKDRPLGISPLYVQRDDQIIGLTHLLTLGLRLLTLIETQVRRRLAKTGEQLTGLYAGQPKRATASPSGTALLRAFERTEITLTRVQKGETVSWHITPLPDLLMRILAYLGLSASLYTRLVENST